ncbi:unnamed protein product [Paramecium sonneborni]|uniref:Transmembrane protein n=1 Tax=Paramecium sonneborni TaxID=65129 RepID=A0A8S1QQI5_9CILI|nr:unnamed protein product [Paramecium sonneborni]
MLEDSGTSCISGNYLAINKVCPKCRTRNCRNYQISSGECLACDYGYILTYLKCVHYAQHVLAQTINIMIWMQQHQINAKNVMFHVLLAIHHLLFVQVVQVINISILLIIAIQHVQQSKFNIMFTISNDKQCLSCPCLLCTSATQCTSCLDGYYLDSTNWIQCNSKYFIYESASKCITCIQDGYTNYKNDYIYNSCEPHCQQCYNGGCSKCDSSYYSQNQICTWQFQLYIMFKFCLLRMEKKDKELSRLIIISHQTLNIIII